MWGHDEDSRFPYCQSLLLKLKLKKKRKKSLFALCQLRRDRYHVFLYRPVWWRKLQNIVRFYRRKQCSMMWTKIALSAQVFSSSKLSETSIRQFRAQLLAWGKSSTDNQSSPCRHLIETNKRKHLQSWQSELETEGIKNCEFLWNCEFGRDDQKQRRQSATEQPVHLAELGLWHIPLATGFVDATELKLMQNPSALIYKSFHLFTGVCCIVSVVVVCCASTV